MQQREKEVEGQLFILGIRVQGSGHIVHPLAITNGGYKISQGSQHVCKVFAFLMVEHFPGNWALGPLKIPSTD